ncbi:hypothetical protein [Delftia sp. DT-2]|uniref:hypothetical protein n=1 Tax=Delftia sp. DT-2 TaxID=3022772 RepID=UPI00233F5697|nr:hypothetical protein [Delftia sp. DT-2]MDC2859041.1 hypothetical protein [Delftia sp. DT-2]
MKIIKQGQPPETRTYQCTCRECATVFEFEQREAKFVFDQRDGDFLQINCPVCGTQCTKAASKGQTP